MNILHKSRLQPLPAMRTIVVFILVFVYSCQKENNSPHFTVVSSYEQVKTMPLLSVQVLLTLAEPQAAGMDSVLAQCKYDVNIYKLVYKTTFKGEALEASGLVCAPKAEGSFPLLSFQNGTNAKKANAPSENLDDQQFSLMQAMASAGFIVVIPDYIGFGASASLMHPYYHRESNDAAITDMIRAAAEFTSSGIPSASNDGKLFLMGYSQGGWATMSALKSLEDNPLPNLEIVAASCGAGGYDLRMITTYLLQQTNYPAPMYLPYYLESHIANGLLNMPLSDVFTSEYASKIPGLFDGSYSNDEIDQQLTGNIPAMMTGNFLSGYDTAALFLGLRNDLDQNSISAWHTSHRILLGAGTEDQHVPPAQTDSIYKGFLDEGVPSSSVQLAKYEGKDHITGLLPWGVQTINWFISLK